MADFQGIAKQFVEFYYKTFDSDDRQQLAGLYVCAILQLVGQDG